MRPRELESYFAVPVPDSITVTNLTFVAQDGSAVADVDVPPLPKGLGGGYGGLLTSARNKPPQPNDADRDTRDNTGAVDRNEVPIDAVTTETDPAQVTLPPESTTPAEQCESCPPDLDIIGTLDVPAIGLSVPLGDVIDDFSIRAQPSLDPASASIGDPGVAVIRGNRTTYGAPFFCLDTLTPGDTVNVTTDDGDYRFSVTGTEILPHDAPLPETVESTLLLIANHPKYTAWEQVRVTAILDTTPTVDDQPDIVHSSCTND